MVEDPVRLVVPHTWLPADEHEVLDGLIIEFQIVPHDKLPVLEVRLGLEGHPLWRVICQYVDVVPKPLHPSEVLLIAPTTDVVREVLPHEEHDFPRLIILSRDRAVLWGRTQRM